MNQIYKIKQCDLTINSFTAFSRLKVLCGELYSLFNDYFNLNDKYKLNADSYIKNYYVDFPKKKKKKKLQIKNKLSTDFEKQTASGSHYSQRNICLFRGH